jgi:hypothetical protein
MDAMLVGLRDVEVLVYLDDLLIFSETIEEHVRRMRLVFDRVREANFKLNIAKCTFAVPEIVYLGHVVNENGVSPDPSKVSAIKNFPKPRNVKDIRSFLGFSGYYRSFIQNYAAISRPLTQMTRKDERFVWTEKQQQAFENLKAALTSHCVGTSSFRSNFHFEYGCVRLCYFRHFKSTTWGQGKTDQFREPYAKRCGKEL